MTKLCNAIQKANDSSSKLSPEALSVEGMTGKKIRHMLNNLVSEDTRYLEIGCWKGATFISAMYGNHPQWHLVVDNWTQFGGPRNLFRANCVSLLGYEPNLCDQDCFSIDVGTLNGINLYLYDGLHREEDQYKALTHFYPALSDSFTLLVDDYDDKYVKLGTQRAIKDLGLQIEDEHILTGRFDSDAEEWWCGMYAAELRKK